MVTIAYNGSNILNTGTAGTYTLATNGKVMASDLVATVDSASKLTVNYNGTTILNNATSGTYTLPTNGKVMASNLAVIVAAAAVEKTVSISLTNPVYPGDFGQGIITGRRSNETVTKTVSITSPTYSGTITFPSDTASIYIQISGTSSDIRVMGGTATTTGNVVFIQAQGNYPRLFIFRVTGSGTINIDGIRYDEF